MIYVTDLRQAASVHGLIYVLRNFSKITLSDIDFTGIHHVLTVYPIQYPVALDRVKFDE